MVKSASTLLDKTYAFDVNSRVTGITDAVTAASTATYAYSLDGRLNRAAGAWGDQGWTYDAVGNRAQETRYSSGSPTGTTAYAYPGTANRLTSLTPTDANPARAFTYTPDGHMASDTRTGLARVFTYDQAGRLSQVADNGGTATTYAYDTFERRVARNAPGEGLRHFVFLTDGRLAGEYEGTSGAVIAEYLWLGDALVGEVSAAGVVTYVQTGPLGQPLAAMDAAGAVAWRGELAPFGELVTSTGTPVPKLRFVGQWTEPGSGLHQNWHRTYDATLGRYLEADPLGIAAGQSLYGYVGQDPLNRSDASGLDPNQDEPRNDAGDNLIGGVGTMVRSYRFLQIPGTEMAKETTDKALADAGYVEPPPNFLEFCIVFANGAVDVRDARSLLRKEIPNYSPAPRVPGGYIDQKGVLNGERMTRR